MALRDLALAGRTLSRTPFFTFTAALTLALGVGATTAIFSVAHAVLLRPLPYANPERLVIVYSDLRARDNLGMPFSYENFADIRNGTRGSFEELGAVFTGRQVFPAADGRPEQVRVALVTTNIFRLMGAKIAFGRDFIDDDALPQPQPQPQIGGAPQAPQTPPLPQIAILSHGYWQRRYGGRTDILGQMITPGGPQRAQIVGVLAPGFELLFAPEDNVEPRPDVWVANRPRYSDTARLSYYLRPIGRLKPGVPLERAQDEVETVADHIRRHFPVYGTANYYARVEPMHRALVTEVRPAILALTGGALFLLLIACANVANLLLVRASARETELAVRSALGAGWWRIARQMLAEALVVAALGTVAGVALAWAGVRALLAVAPANLPRVDEVALDFVVLAFAALTGLIAAALFGLAPAWRAFRLNVMDVLRGSTRTEGLRRASALRNAVVVAQVALCFVLLVGSGLMLRSFRELQRVDPGFDTRGVLTFQLLGGRRGPPQERAATIRELQDAVRALPGVQSVTASYPLPLAGDFSTIRWGTEAALADNSKYQAVDWQAVLPGYFETLHTPLLEGRTFTDADNQSRRNVVVVDRVLAARAFPGESAVGRRILIRIRTPEPEWVEIIGVVEHQRVTSLREAGREQVYFADGFLGFGATRKWAVRTAGDPARLTDAIRAQAARLDPQWLMTDVATMETLVYRAQATTRFSLLLIASFAAAAALLVAVGLYGVLSTMVRQRTAEIGVRMALGSAPAGILRLVVGQGMRLGAGGMFLGLLAALAVTRVMTTMLLGVTPTDPLTYVSMAAVFFVIAALAAWLPARRAAALDPTVALRAE
ncbi:MAG TPA: ABC transporter permease [Vicinamibacterales bacterium]|nr:ABC transporter permease [Vicinamibacterales bacterium]